MCEDKLESRDLYRRLCDRPETSRKRAIEKDKNGLISYTYEYEQ